MRLETLVMLIPFVGACGPTDEQIDARITARLIAERVIEPPPPPPDPAKPPPPAPPPPDPVGTSNAFLAKLDELMADYQPALPDVTDDTDLLRCVTTDAIKSDPDLSKAGKALERRREATRKERERARKAFFSDVYPVQFRIDPGWHERHATTPVYGCYYHVYHDSYGDQTSESECCEGGYYCPEVRYWQVRSTKEAPEFRYSGTLTAEPPELMKRLDAAHLITPERFACRVDDVVVVKDHRTALCVGGSQVRMFGDVAATTPNVGDVISVPVAGVMRDPNGVLWKDLERGAWVIDADTATVTIDERATCPTVDEILAAAAP